MNDGPILGIEHKIQLGIYNMLHHFIIKLKFES